MRMIVLAAVLFFPLAVAAEDRVEDVVKQAIAAAGGRDVLDRYPAGRVVGKGTMSFAGVDTAFTFEQAYQLPGRFRTHVLCEVKGQRWELLQAMTDGVARQTINGQTIPLTEATRRELQTAALLNEIGQLSPLVSERKFSAKPDKQVKGSETAGLLVTVKGFPEFRCGFDRRSGHLVRIGYKDLDPDTAKECELETTYDEFKTAAGIIRPTHAVVTRDGKKVVDVQVERFTPLERIDPAAFQIPE